LLPGLKVLPGLFNKLKANFIIATHWAVVAGCSAGVATHLAVVAIHSADVAVHSAVVAIH